MKYSDLFEETIFSLSINKVRSGLTVLGIVIGIASVIAMVAIGQGAQATIESNIQSIGSNLVLVTPGAQRGTGGGGVNAGRGTAQTLTQADADAIGAQVSSLKAIAPENSRRYQVVARGKNTNTQVVGTVSAYADVRNIQVDTGNFISDSQVRSMAKVAVIGPTTRDDLFGAGSDPTGQSIRINHIEFKVAGVTRAKGGSGFSNQDDMIFVPISTAQRFLAGGEYVTTISVQAVSQDLMATVQQEITNLLLQRHHLNDPLSADFSVLNQSDIVAAATSTTGIFTVLLASIAGISLLVGGIGIMNMMLTTVTERTREIGLRMAIGGKGQDISYQFLAESVMLTFFGGVFGVILGWLMAMLVSSLMNMPTSISLSSVLLAFGVSAGIGVVFGYYPAKRASRMNPIEALRYE